MLSNFIIAFSLCFSSLGTYLIWFSRKNIFNHLNLGACFVFYAVPAFVLNYNLIATESLLNLYVAINLIGGLAFLAGLLIGYHFRSVLLIDLVIPFKYLKTVAGNTRSISRMTKVASSIYIIALVGLVVSYMLMGFMPLFASDPFMAKFFKGQYQEPYQRVAFLYRSSRQLLEFLIPLKVLQAFSAPSLKNIVLIFFGIALIAVSLNRGPIFSGFLVALAIVVALKKSHLPFYLFISFIFFAFVIGSSAYFVVGFLFPESIFRDAYTSSTFLEAIVSGSPDIADQLKFLNAFTNGGSKLTYGLTFIGGLIPFNFPWNPSVYTLTVLNDNPDISNIASGGLRLPVSVWGYVSFGWLGVVLVPLLSAFFTGYIVKRTKIILGGLTESSDSYAIFFLMVFIYSNIGAIYMGFFALSIYTLPAVFVYYIFLWSMKRRTSKTLAINVSH